MRYKKVFLVSNLFPVVLPISIWYRNPPAGIGYIVEALEQRGIECDVLDMGLRYNERDLINKIIQFRPELVGISMKTMSYKKQYNLLEKLKKLAFNFDIVVGGPHVAFLREKVLKDCSSIDFGLVGEGEKAMVGLCEGKRTDVISGLIWRDNGQIIYNNELEFIENLDSISFPKYKNFELDKYPTKAIGIVSSRGCPYNCIFCAEHLLLGKRFRARSPKNVVDEIEYWYHRGYRRFEFADSNFSFHKDRVNKICDEIEKRNIENVKFELGLGIRADRIDKNLLKRMKEVGFIKLGIGVESGNNKVLMIMKKGETKEQIEKVVRDACELGYDVQLTFQVGTPGETYSDFKDSISLALRYPVQICMFYNQMPIPGTELFDIVKRNNQFLITPEEYLNNPLEARSLTPFFETCEFPFKERKKALKETQRIERIVFQRYLLRRLREKYGVHLPDVLGEIIIRVYILILFFKRKWLRTNIIKLKFLRFFERNIDKIRKLAKKCPTILKNLIGI